METLFCNGQDNKAEPLPEVLPAQSNTTLVPKLESEFRPISLEDSTYDRLAPKEKELVSTIGGNERYTNH